jgi:AmiR/NasT family two-component response regulator
MPSAPAASRPVLLLASNDRDFAEQVTSQVAERFDVELASTTRYAYTAALRHEAHVVLVDVTSDAAIQGVQLATCLRSVVHFTGALVVVSPERTPGLMDLSRRLGFDAVVSKPLEEHALKTVLASVNPGWRP